MLYVETLIGPHTVNTLPPSTLAAFKDHGRAERTIDRDLSAPRAQLEALEALGISMAAVTDQLEREGVEKFSHSYEALLQTIERRAGAFRQEIGRLQPPYRAAVARLAESEFGRRLWSTDNELAQDLPGSGQWLDAPRNAAAELIELQGLQEAFLREGREILGWVGLGPAADLAETMLQLEPSVRSLRLESLNSIDPRSVRKFMRKTPARRSLTVMGDFQLAQREIQWLLDMLWSRAERMMGGAAGQSFLALSRRDSSLGSEGSKDDGVPEGRLKMAVPSAVPPGLVLSRGNGFPAMNRWAIPGSPSGARRCSSSSEAAAGASGWRRPFAASKRRLSFAVVWACRASWRLR